jgi:hypothetical protein
MEKLNLKKLTFENWIEPDSLMSMFEIEESDGSFRIKTAKEWFDDIYEIKLSDKVPDEIHDLFEVARGTMTYGYFYYPIYTFAEEQFSRIVDAAISLRCQSMNMPTSIETLFDKIDWLSKELEFTEEEISRMTSYRKLRNSWSHPKKQTLLGPGPAISSMVTTAKVINHLF